MKHNSSEPAAAPGGNSAESAAVPSGSLAGPAAAPCGNGAESAAAPGGVRRGELATSASRGNLARVWDFAQGYLERLRPSDRERMGVELAMEEIFINIASYAYADGHEGAVTVRCEADQAAGRLTVTFIDGGAPYNPLERGDPDTDLALRERPIGGLGIFMAKRLMDAMDYRYENGENILALVKHVAGRG
ncbi:MAG: ATP-binding protein [Clostridiales bacterium]|jgi:anti-sigma regulatory factor (Ser/Thr protein kinase)|nr:ATP-binding protein [Clostridiales bacterium]